MIGLAIASVDQNQINYFDLARMMWVFRRILLGDVGNEKNFEGGIGRADTGAFVGCGAQIAIGETHLVQHLTQGFNEFQNFPSFIVDAYETVAYPVVAFSAW